MNRASVTASFSPNRPTSKRIKTLKAALEGYLYLAPTLIVLAIFVYLPVFASFKLSLNRIAPFGNQMRYVGFENYTRLLTDPDYWNSILVTAILTAGIVVVGNILAVFIALALAHTHNRSVERLGEPRGVGLNHSFFENLVILG